MNSENTPDLLPRSTVTSIVLSCFFLLDLDYFDCFSYFAIVEKFYGTITANGWPPGFAQLELTKG
jgi:hypothetical protein